MSRLFRVALAFLVLIGVASVARAADIRDLLLLQQAGLTDELMIDLIQTDGSVFHLTAADIVDLHHKGLSDRVIRAMLATARKPGATDDKLPLLLQDVPPAPPEDRAQAIVTAPPLETTPPSAPAMEDAPPASAPAAYVDTGTAPSATIPATQVVQVFVPVEVPVPVVVERHHPDTPPAPPPAPVYWGYGGQKKPGSWDEPGVSPAPPPTPPATPAKPVPPKSGRGGL